jgi:hypothetical protein
MRLRNTVSANPHCTVIRKAGKRRRNAFRTGAVCAR